MTGTGSFEMLKLEEVRERIEAELRDSIIQRDRLTVLIEHMERRLIANAQQLDAARRKQS